MKWIKERDLLIAQTKAFVQSVAGKQPMAGGRDVLRDHVLRGDAPRDNLPPDEFLRDNVLRDMAIEATPVNHIAEVKQPVEAVQVNRPLPVRIGGFREEILGRVAAFRAHQELFHRERDKYCNSVLTKLHASTDQRKALDDQPPKP
jgi:hypothetical protein